MDDLPQLYHALDPALGGFVQLQMSHNRVFAVVDFPVHHRIGEVLYVGVGGQEITACLGFSHIRGSVLGLPVFAFQMGDGLLQLVGKVDSFQRQYRAFLPAILGALGGQFSQDHLGMVHKILVDGDAALGLAQLHPVGFPVDGMVTLLEKNNIGHHVGAGVGPERIIGQPDGPQQVGPFGHILTGTAVLGIQRVPAGDKGHHAARAHLVQRLGKEIVVDGESQLVVILVVHPILTKGHIANGKIVEVLLPGGLKARHRDLGFRVELLGNAARDAVQFHAVQLTSRHALGKHPEEIAYAAGRFQDVAGLKAHALYCIIDGTDHGRAGVMGVQGAGPGGSIFLRGQQFFQLRVFLGPAVLVRVKGVGKAAPANVLGQNFLFFRGSVPVFRLQSLQGADGLHIAGKLLLGAAFAQMIVGDAEVPGGRRGRFLFGRLNGWLDVEFFDHYIIGQVCFFCRVGRYRFRGKGGPHGKLRFPIFDLLPKGAALLIT